MKPTNMKSAKAKERQAKEKQAKAKAKDQRAKEKKAKEKRMTEKKPDHGRLAPSSSGRWMSCPGSINLLDKLPTKVQESAYCIEGRRAHKLHELSLNTGEEPHSFVNKLLKSDDGDEFKVTIDMADAVKISIDHIGTLLFTSALLKLKTTIHVEVFCDLRHLGIPGLIGGTADVVILLHDRSGQLKGVHIFDYKHGAGVAVDVDENSQLMCYALGMMHIYYCENKSYCAHNVPVTLHIHQPRAYHEDGPIREWSITLGDLTNWQYEELMPAAKRALEADAPLVPSDEACRFCDAAGICPELFKITEKCARLEFNESAEHDDKSVDFNPKGSAELNIEQRVFIVRNAKRIKLFLKSAMAQIAQEITNGSELYKKHLKLTRAKTKRKFTLDAFEEFDSPLMDYLTIDDTHELKVKSISKIEKLLKSSVSDNDRVKQIMGQVTYRPPGDLSVVPIDDERDAYAPGDDFLNLKNTL